MKRRSMYGLTFLFCLSRLSRLSHLSSSTVVDIIVVCKTKEDLEFGEVREEAVGLRAVFLGRQKQEARFAIDALLERSKVSLS